MAAILAEGLTKVYGDLRAVDGVSLEVPEGEFVGVLGPNGAGKTTLLEMIEGLRRPDGGTVEVLGEPVWPRNPRLLPRIGVQLQASAFFERLTAREQIRTFAALYDVSPARAALDRSSPGIGIFTEIDVILTMRPKPRSTMPSTTLWISSIGVIMFMVTPASMASRSSSRKSLNGGPPLLLIKMSGFGQASRSKRCPSGVPTSARTGVMRTSDMFSISCAVAARSISSQTTIGPVTARGDS